MRLGIGGVRFKCTSELTTPTYILFSSFVLMVVKCGELGRPHDSNEFARVHTATGLANALVRFTSS
jgi:hypothetical protein